MPDQEPVALGRLRRAIPLAGLTARAVSGRFIAEFRDRIGDEGALERYHEANAARYTEFLGQSKGAMMKIGQLLSMIDMDGTEDGVATPYQEAFARLQSDVPPMTSDLVRGIIATQLGSESDLFADFDETPIAAASIGQVHRAVLRDGRDVAVKVQYPGVGAAIREDLANADLIATVVGFVKSASGASFNPRSMIQELTLRVIEEVDYGREAATIARFSSLYRDHPFIRVPDVITEACSDQVLTMTYVEGMDWAAAQRQDQDLKNQWAETIIRFGDGNFRHSNLLHADPHPGNYRFNADGTVGFVDFGCVKVLSEPRRRLWVSLIRDAIDGRKEDLRKDLVRGGFIDEDSSMTSAEAYEWYSQVLYEIIVAPQPATYSPASGARTARWVFGLDSENPLSKMTIPDDYVFAPRIFQAMTSLCGSLRATLPTRSIADDMDGLAEPTTALGKLHHAWVRERGLPSAFDDHEALLPAGE